MEQQATHTPGPWTVFDQSWSNTAVIAGDECICALDINHATEDTQEALEAVMAANARLIAAAPEMLAALRDLEIGANTVAACYTRNPGNFAAALRDLGDYADKARAAIARVTPAHQ